ncbi:hypothetical protein FOL46_002961 [Perkinsus olseni]|uniref:Mannosidase, endo-alpha n=1 Tax=Perkinsus olseni TaxID=32597 RepID=A0A7J6MXW9_PEROL|nr:hypothetical protein FOL46_002961 [Perkinsus olseni]
MTTEQHRIEKSATTGQSAETDSSCGWRCNVHGFYYVWYRSKGRDWAWAHWNHRRLPHWDPQIAKKYPPGLHDPALDGRNETVDLIGSLLLDAAWDHGMRIAIHLEPYEGRDPVSVRKDFEYIHQHYGSHPALHRVASTHGGALLPLIFTDLPDGFCTYFAATGFVYGSTPSNWPHMSRVARDEGIYFIPSVGPGYIDVEVRPWNYANTRDRRGGGYFDDMFTEAAKLQPEMVSITSFNEWHEGTNIEPAVDGKSTLASLKWPSREYLSYGTDPEFYLTKTRQWAERIFEPSHDVVIS